MATNERPNARTQQQRADHVHRPESEPRLPHERDESADSQPMPQPPNDAPIRQAAEDVERGLVDTDEGRRAHAVEQPPRKAQDRRR